jgi:hypothetical protein
LPRVPARNWRARRQDRGKFGLKLEEWFLSQNPKPHAFLRTLIGSMVEREASIAICGRSTGAKRVVSSEARAGVYRGEIGSKNNIFALPSALEQEGGHSPMLPGSFRNSRSNIRLSIGPGSDRVNYDMLFDVTSEGRSASCCRRATRGRATQTSPLSRRSSGPAMV